MLYQGGFRRTEKQSNDQYTCNFVVDNGIISPRDQTSEEIF